MRVISSALFMLVSGWAQASGQVCDSGKIIAQAWPDAVSTADNSVNIGNATVTLAADTPRSIICKVWPARPELTLAAVPLMTTPADAEGYSTGDLELLVLDSASLQVKQRLRLKNRMDDDAMYISDISLDTARWKVAPDQLAFGLRIAKSGSSRANPFHEEVLSLFITDNTRLRPILNGVVVTDSSGEWDGRCAGTFSDITRTLSLSDTARHDYADIIVSEKRSESVDSETAGDCRSKETRHKASYRLSYNGNAYAVPENLKPLE